MSIEGYTFHARLRPVLVLLVPIALTVTLLFPIRKTKESIFAASGTYLILTALFSQFGRDSGKRKQSALWKLWGGCPSVRILRHRDKTLSRETLQRYHAQLSAALGRSFPSLDEERANPKDADALYASAVDFLKEQTRDKARFHLVYAENVNYGFRRNLWGMKPAGATIALICSILSVLIFSLHVFNAGLSAMYPYGIVTAVNVTLLVWWFLRITPDWVRIPAESYALQLVAASDSLKPSHVAALP